MAATKTKRRTKKSGPKKRAHALTPEEEAEVRVAAEKIRDELADDMGVDRSFFDPESPLGKIRSELSSFDHETWAIDMGQHFGSKGGLAKRYADHILSNLRMATVLGPFKKLDIEAKTFEVDSRHDLRCADCDEEVAFRFDLTKKSVAATTKCAHTDGAPPYSVRINVPSGKLLFANDLRVFLKVNDGYDVNYVSGQRKTTEAYAARGMVHISVGNTCPSIYQKGNVITLATRKEDVKPKPGEGDFGKKKGSICTDLWWFCAIDLDLLESLVPDAAVFDKIKKDSHTTILTVEPGMYMATSYGHIARQSERKTDPLYSEKFEIERRLAGQDPQDHTKKLPKPKGEEAEKLKARLKAVEEQIHKAWHDHCFEVFATMERIGEVGEIEEHKAALQAFSTPTFESAIAVSAMAYPSIYPTRRRVIEHTFLSYGNGLDWQDGALYSVDERHEKARAAYDKGERPIWRNDRHGDGTLYPVCGYSAIFTVPDDVRLDWLKGVYEAVRMMLALDHTKSSSSGHTNADNIASARMAMKLLDLRFGGVNYTVQQMLQSFPDRFQTREQVLVNMLCDSAGDWTWRTKTEHDDARVGTPGGPTDDKISLDAQKRGAYPVTGPSRKRARRISSCEPVAWDGEKPISDFAMVDFGKSSLAYSVPKKAESNWLLACVEALDLVINSQPLPASDQAKREATIARAIEARARLEKRLSERAVQQWKPKLKKRKFDGDVPKFKTDSDEERAEDKDFEDRERVLSLAEQQRQVDVGFFMSRTPDGLGLLTDSIKIPRNRTAAWARWHAYVWALCNPAGGCDWLPDGKLLMLPAKKFTMPKGVDDFAAHASFEGSPITRIPDNVDLTWLGACLLALEAVILKNKPKAKPAVRKAAEGLYEQLRARFKL